MGSRRDFLAEGLCLAGAGIAPASVAKSALADELRSDSPGQKADTQAAITPSTIAEAAKIHALQFSQAQRQELADAIPAQVKTVVGLRQVARPLALQPAIHFDPRIPGERYPQQKNLVRLANAKEVPLPRGDTAVAYAPLT